jgi:hypothetical protein
VSRFVRRFQLLEGEETYAKSLGYGIPRRNHDRNKLITFSRGYTNGRIEDFRALHRHKKSR